jgi:hypothetical protein
VASERQQRLTQCLERGLGRRPIDTAPPDKRFERGRSKEMQVAADELLQRLRWRQIGLRHGPHRRLTRAGPPNQNGPGQRGITKAIRMHAQRLADGIHWQPSTVQIIAQPISQGLRSVAHRSAIG